MSARRVSARELELLERRLLAVESVGTCSQCGAEGAVLFFLGGEWCVACRARQLDELPPLSAPVKEHRGDVVVEHDGEVYRFTSKAEARRGMRALLRRQRLPSDVARQIGGES